MSTADELPDGQYSDADAREILKRAAEIDSSGILSETELRSIAGEANISQAALEKALGERRVQSSKPRYIVMPPAENDENLPFYNRPLKGRHILLILAAVSVIPTICR
jgi:hypothetical protein